MMHALLGSEPFLFPSLGGPVLDVIRIAYGVLLLATIAGTLPHARRYFLSDRWGGYAQSSAFVDSLQNPVVLPVLVLAWLGSGIALVVGREVIAAQSESA